MTAGSFRATRRIRTFGYVLGGGGEEVSACVGNVGEDGILADTWYKVEDGKLVAVI